jgi:hypothetical protein
MDLADDVIRAEKDKQAKALCEEFGLPSLAEARLWIARLGYEKAKLRLLVYKFVKKVSQTDVNKSVDL